MRKDDPYVHVFQNRNWSSIKCGRWFFFLILTVKGPFHRMDFKWKKYIGVQGQFLKKQKLCKQHVKLHQCRFKICPYLRLHLKIICRRFHMKTPFKVWDMRTWDMWKVCLQTFRNNSRILRIKRASVFRVLFLIEHKHKERFSNLH